MSGLDKMALVIILLGLCLLGSVGGIITLAALGVTIPDVLQNIAVGSLTGLAGVLARPSDSRGLSDGPPE